ncbi:MAG: ankyrin repeat domain-containing protein [bacterium]|nr:MAG: ankyrin repeat domain-containing protein [bacterium]
MGVRGGFLLGMVSVFLALPGTVLGHHDIFGPASSGDLQRLEYVLNAEPELVNVISKAGLTPLHTAVIGGHGEAVRLLVSRGADINARDSGMNTPLHWAALAGDADLVRLLLDEGARYELSNGKGQTALDICESGGHAEAAGIIRDHAGAR